MAVQVFYMVRSDPDKDTSTIIKRNLVKILKDIHGSQRMNYENFDKALSFPLMPAAGLSFIFPVKYLNI